MSVSLERWDSVDADITREMIDEYLENQGIQFGIDPDKIEEFVTNDACGRVIVAHGVPAIQSVPEKIRFFFNHGGKPKPSVQPDGRVDFRSLNLVENVTAGQVVAEITPAIAGSLGRDIFGNSLIPDPVHPLQIELGKNVRRIKNSILATVDGCPKYDGRRLDVVTDITISGDIGVSTGNITAVGNLIVTGSVMRGFEVKCGGDMRVNGFIDEALVTVDGNLVVDQGIATQSQGMLQVYGSITTHHIDSSKVYCGHDISVETSIMHSDITCDGCVSVGGEDGSIMGGHVQARKGIFVAIAGSKFMTSTRLEVGYQFLTETTKAIRTKIEIIDAKLLELMDELRALQLEMSGKSGQANDHLLLKKDELTCRIAQFHDKKATLQTSVDVASGDVPKIIVRGICHGGVQVVIQGIRLVVDDPLTGVEFRELDGQIVIQPLNP